MAEYVPTAEDIRIQAMLPPPQLVDMKLVYEKQGVVDGGRYVRLVEFYRADLPGYLKEMNSLDRSWRQAVASLSKSTTQPADAQEQAVSEPDKGVERVKALIERLIKQAKEHKC